jgi:hypothetical protein
MPVDGYRYKRVWQYIFRPQPYPVLDTSWDCDVRQWEHDVVERLRRGEAAPRAILTDILIPTETYPGTPTTWEHAEKIAEYAIRDNSAFMDDETIRLRKAHREARKQAFAENKAKWKQFHEAPALAAALKRAEKIKRNDQARAERLEEERLYEERKAERTRQRAEQDAEWKQRQHEIAKEFAERARLKPAIIHDIEQTAIMARNWECKHCKGRADVRPQKGADGYILKCTLCGATGVGSHNIMYDIVRAG